VHRSTAYAVIADPQSLRWQLYQQAIDKINPPVRIVLLPWQTVIEREGEIDELLPADASLLRVESPARDFSLIRLLLQAGQRAAGQTPDGWQPPAKGWLASPKLVYQGLCRILRGVDHSVRRHPQCELTSNLSDTLTLFDKNAVSVLLKTNDIPTPDVFAPQSRRHLLQEMESRNWTAAFVKLAYGSCGAGIARINVQNDRMVGITTVLELAGQFHNTRNVSRPSGPEMARVVDFLVQEQATVQAVIAKTKVLGDEFDVRVVVVDGDVVASVFRASHLPITNLHLGGYRADAEQCRRLISRRAWADAMEHCRRAAGLFDMAAVGIDLAFDAVSGQPAILEINAFGDFFPNWKDGQGRTISELEIQATLRRHGVL
jgi:glutathione synthase/RimK-type ligase-like ATP-grasp enzyme